MQHVKFFFSTLNQSLRRASSERGIITVMAAGSIIGATPVGRGLRPGCVPKGVAWMRVAGCGQQDRVCDFKLSIGAFCCTAYGRNWHFSEVTDEASDFRLGGQSRLNASVAR